MDDTAGSGGAARRRTTGSPAKPPGKTRAKAATGSGRAAAAPAKRASGTSRTARTRTAPAGPEPGPGGPGWSGPPERAGWRASRSRALYSRRIQRVNERWPLATQVATALLSRPELVLGALGQPQPIARDGRLLNRRVQAMLELATRFDGARATGGGGPSGDPVELRAQLRRATQLAMPVRTDVHGWGRVVPGPDGAPPVPVRLYRQYGTGLGLGGDGRSLPGIVYYHGGSWVTGDLDTHDATCRLLAATARCLVVAVDYRRAPEDPFPAAVDDALAAYVWVQRHADELGIDRRRIGVMGDSAGGNLAAVVALEARAGGSVAAGDVLPPAAQGLVYPVVDARLDTESSRQLGEDFFLTRAEPGAGPGLVSARRLGLDGLAGVPPAGRGPPGRGPGPGGHGGLRPPAGRRGRTTPTCSGPPGSRSSTGATTTRSTGSWGWASCPSRWRWPRRCATPWAGSSGGRPRPGSRPSGTDLYSWAMDRSPGMLALVGGGEWSEGCTFDAGFLAASGSDEVLVLPTAGGLRAPRATGGPGR